MIDDTARDAERAELLELLAHHIDHGHPVPCLAVPPADRGAWTSDDPGEQALARSLCAHCPAIAPCRAYGEQYPRELGTYGARTNVGRPTARRTTRRKAV